MSLRERHDAALAEALESFCSGTPGTVVSSPPGAGKSFLVELASASWVLTFGARVLVAAQSNSQAVDLARRIAVAYPQIQVTFFVRSGAPTDLEPERGAPFVVDRHDDIPDGPGVIVATSAKLHRQNQDRLRVDALIVDEAWQLPDWSFAYLMNAAPDVPMLLVGDPGQIEPFAADDYTEALLYRSFRPAPETLLERRRESGDVHLVKLPSTRRLGPKTAELVSRAFYASEFGSTRPSLVLNASDRVWSEAAEHEIVTVTVPADLNQVGRGLLDRVGELIGSVTNATVTDQGAERPVTCGVIAPHRRQVAAIRSVLDGYDVQVETANRWQGLECDVAVVVHPLVGRDEATEFSLNPGRLCVSLSRHRTAAVLVVPENLEHLVAVSAPPARTFYDNGGVWASGRAASRRLLSVPQVS